MEFKIIFCDLDAGFIDSYEKYLKSYKNTSFYHGSFVELDGKFDCIVSPGNSFGIFDGGVDAVINRYFPEIDQFIVKMQRQLLAKCGGYQQPGTCIMFETDVAKCPYIAHAPTMGIPMIITDFSIIYNAMWSILIEIHKHNKEYPDKKINSVLCPGLGTGAGHVNRDVAYQLMKLALDDYLEYIQDHPQTHPRYLITWEAATKRYKKLYKLIESFDKTSEYDMYDHINIKKLRL